MAPRWYFYRCEWGHGTIATRDFANVIPICRDPRHLIEEVMQPYRPSRPPKSTVYFERLVPVESPRRPLSPAPDTRSGDYDSSRGIDPELDALIDEYERVVAAASPTEPEPGRFSWSPVRQARSAIGDWTRTMTAKAKRPT